MEATPAADTVAYPGGYDRSSSLPPSISPHSGILPRCLPASWSMRSSRAFCKTWSQGTPKGCPPTIRTMCACWSWSASGPASKVCAVT